jgi:hypothetical protein
MPFHPQALTRPALKSLAKALQKASPEVLGHPIAQHQAQELLARQLGYAHWHEAYSRAGQMTAPPGQSTPDEAQQAAVSQKTKTSPPWSWEKRRQAIQMRPSMYVDELDSLTAMLDPWLNQVALEAIHGHTTRLQVEITENGDLWVVDNGRPWADQLRELMDFFPEKTRKHPANTPEARAEKGLAGPLLAIAALLPKLTVSFFDPIAAQRYSVTLVQGQWHSFQPDPSPSTRESFTGLVLHAPLGTAFNPWIDDESKYGSLWLNSAEHDRLRATLGVYAQVAAGLEVTFRSPQALDVLKRPSGEFLDKGTHGPALHEWSNDCPYNHRSLFRAAFERDDQPLIQALQDQPSRDLQTLLREFMPRQRTRRTP